MDLRQDVGSYTYPIDEATKSSRLNPYLRGCRRLRIGYKINQGRQSIRHWLPNHSNSNYYVNVNVKKEKPDFPPVLPLFFLC